MSVIHSPLAIAVAYREPQQQTRLAHTRVSDQEQFEQVVTAHRGIGTENGIVGQLGLLSSYQEWVLFLLSCHCHTLYSTGNRSIWPGTSVEYLGFFVPELSLDICIIIAFASYYSRRRRTTTHIKPYKAAAQPPLCAGDSSQAT